MARGLGLGKESTWNTAVAPDIWLEVQSEGIEKDPAFARLKTIRERTTRKVVHLADVTRGPATVYVNYQDIPFLWYYLLGSVTTSGPVGSVYTHVSPGTTNGMANARPSVTVEVQRDEADGGDTWKYTGCVLTGLSVTASLEDALTAEFNVLGADEELTAAGTPAYPDFDVVIPSEITVEFDDVALDCTAFSLSCNFPADEPKVLGSTSLAQKPKDSDTLEVTGEATVLWDTDAAAVYTNFSSKADQKVELVCDTGGDETMTVVLNKCKVTKGTPHVDGRNRLVTTFTFDSYFNTTATGAIAVTTENDDADPVTDE